MTIFSVEVAVPGFKRAHNLGALKSFSTCYYNYISAIYKF